MATVTLSDLWIHEVGDFGTYKTLKFSVVSPVSQSDTKVVRMAQGRQVAITTPGVMRQWKVGLKFPSRADAQWLRAQEGQTKYIRTTHGETFFAVISGVSEIEDILPGVQHTNPTAAVDFTLTEVTLSEAV